MQNNIATAQKPPTHLARLNGAELRFHQDDFDTALPAFVAEHGGGVPAVYPIQYGAPPNSRKIAELVIADAAPAPAEPVILVGQYDATGDARSAEDRAAARAAGFSPAQPVFRQGLRADGMRGHREEFDKLPLARAAASALVRQVEDEERRDVSVRATDVRVNKEGLLALGRSRLEFSDRAFGSLVSRLGMPAGASTYLPAIDPELRAMNVNHWVADRVVAQERQRAALAALEKRTYEPEELVVRTRNVAAAPGEDITGFGREAFAVVSPSYAQFDADKIAAAIQLAVPADARASWSYDGRRSKFDVLFFSDLTPEKAVAGEFFKAGVQVRSDDTGGGSCVVDAVVWQNLCLNFIVIDEDHQNVARLRHVGSVEELAKKFDKAFADALKKIGYFTKMWGYAVEEDVTASSLVLATRTKVITEEEASSYAALPVSKAIEGFFNGLVEKDLVPLPKRDRAQTVKDLVRMWEKDESAATLERETKLTRAAVVNAVTRYAHEVNIDPFLEPEIEAAGGRLLFGPRGGAPAPLPFVPLRK